RDVAQTIYERLFFYVFQLLSSAGQKRLIADDLRTQLGLPVLSAGDQQLSDKVRGLLSEIELRVTTLEEVFKQQQHAIQQMDSQLQVISQQVGVSTAIDYSFGLPQLDMPPLVEPLVRRQPAVSWYIEQLGMRTWCALHAEVGRGKTCLLR